MAILVHKRVPFSPTKVIENPQEGHVIVLVSLYFKPVVLVNVYAPTWDDENFVEGVKTSIPSLNAHSLNFGENLNCVTTPSLDRSNPKSDFPFMMAK